MKTSENDLINARKAAEAAVEGMTDAALKRTAFEIAFKHLLAGSEPAESESGSRSAKGARKRRARKAPGKVGTPRRSRPQGGAQARVQELVGDGFFRKKARDINNVIEELRRNGHRFTQSQISPALLGLTKAKTLRRQKEADAKGRERWVYEEKV